MGVCCSKGFEVGFENDDDIIEGKGGVRIRLQGSCSVASMYTQQGKKGINQDAMTLWEDFSGGKDKIFCGVFDGHGPYGHKVARHVRDSLPLKISSFYDALRDAGGEGVEEDGGMCLCSAGCSKDLTSWKSVFVSSFKDMDRELGTHPSIDCFCSGTTAVTLVKQGEHVFIANLGDSRAVLCTRDENNQPVPVQLTVDLKPNLPNEAERIRQCRGRVFASEEEPDVHRLWLPDDNCPGLAMARAFGDFCLKDFGLISVPETFYRRIQQKDEFIVLATDGVWDVLSNQEVVKIISSARNRSTAARMLVDRAVHGWNYKYPTSKVDDCAVICLFLKDNSPLTTNPENADSCGELENSLSSKSASRKSNIEPLAVPPEKGQQSQVDECQWEALDGVSRVDSIVKLPRFNGSLQTEKTEEG